MLLWFRFPCLPLSYFDVLTFDIQLALERKEQSTTLCKIYRDIMSGKKLVQSCEEELSTPAFNDVTELENHFRTLQVLAP